MDLSPFRGEARRIFSLPAHYNSPIDFNYALPTKGVAEFAFVGRSNVGKSSLISKLLGNGKIVRISKEPGCTRTINYYSLAKGQTEKKCQPELYLVDLPGYGFAKAAREEQKKWQAIMEGFLNTRPYSILR